MSVIPSRFGSIQKIPPTPCLIAVGGGLSFYHFPSFSFSLAQHRFATWESPPSARSRGSDFAPQGPRSSCHDPPLPLRALLAPAGRSQLRQRIRGRPFGGLSLRAVFA